VQTDFSECYANTDNRYALAPDPGNKNTEYCRETTVDIQPGVDLTGGFAGAILSLLFGQWLHAKDTGGSGSQ